MSTWTYMNIKGQGQGHSLTLVQGHSGSTFSNFFSWETAMPIEAKLNVASHWDRGTIVLYKWSRSHDQDGRHPIYGKNMKNSSSLEPKGQWPWKFVWCIKCSSTTKLLKWWPWFDLDLFYDEVKFGPLWFLYGKELKQWIFSETIIVYDVKVCRCSQLN